MQGVCGVWCQNDKDINKRSNDQDRRQYLIKFLYNIFQYSCNTVHIDNRLCMSCIIYSIAINR